MWWQVVRQRGLEGRCVERDRTGYRVKIRVEEIKSKREREKQGKEKTEVRCWSSFWFDHNSCDMEPLSLTGICYEHSVRPTLLNKTLSYVCWWVHSQLVKITLLFLPFSCMTTQVVACCINRNWDPSYPRKSTLCLVWLTTTHRLMTNSLNDCMNCSMSFYLSPYVDKNKIVS